MFFDIDSTDTLRDTFHIRIELFKYKMIHYKAPYFDADNVTHTVRGGITG